MTSQLCPVMVGPVVFLLPSDADNGEMWPTRIIGTYAVAALAALLYPEFTLAAKARTRQ